jgi:hypothetical protein
MGIMRCTTLGIVFASILILIGFAFSRAGFESLTRRRGTRGRVTDVAGMPVF